MTGGTADLCDAHPEVQVLAPGYRDYGAVRVFSGPIRTLQCYEDNSLVRELLNTPGNGAVLVVDGAASMRCALLGDLIATSAVDNGWAGVLIHGCVRDVEILAGLALGIKALGSHPRKTQKRGLGDPDIPLAFGGVNFSPGNWLYADETGVLVAAGPLMELTSA